VDEPGVVGERERATDHDPELERSTDRQPPLLLDELLQVLALDVLEDDELPAVSLAAVDDRDDVRMRELRRRPRLAPEALDVVVLGRVLLVQQL